MTGFDMTSNSVMKIALPARLSSKTVQSIFEVAQDKLTVNKNFKLLLDMSQVNQIEQDGLNRLYDLTQLLKSSGSPKVVIRSLNRVVRDALILSNTINLFNISKDV
jgi:anti-anti-sigma regulatory factor